MTAAEPTTDPTANTSRRELLCGLVVALLAPGALAAACSDDSPSGSGGATTGGGATGTAPDGGGGGSGGGTVLAALTSVPEGGGLIVDKPGGGKLLLVRSSGEQVKAYDASCTHMGTTVDPPKGGMITCPNHGSQFDVATGDVKKGPATAPLSTVPVSVSGTNVVLA
ncbi:Rieske (2Fe-2S) protein [Actinophytocola sp.]|uniref:Rieske (2Fe-2S) protein n=1 Tax=Actinophytocola sp. TaxID=1872138 RepID=UPI002D801A8D|nr:Rieske (2Fe-2S) protein [Actinophytocola sp.]HET9139737.1 Rieske (2Fe-2S) protein [Actinophytocola sp.]